LIHPTNIRIVLENSISIKRISLVFMDIPVDDSTTESIYFMTIQELGDKGVRGTRYRDSASFIQIKNAAKGFRTLAFENQSYLQSIDLGQPRTFSEFNIRLRYRVDAEIPLTMSSDYSSIFRIETV
jgi:hypothetical protein